MQVCEQAENQRRKRSGHKWPEIEKENIKEKMSQTKNPAKVEKLKKRKN